MSGFWDSITNSSIGQTISNVWTSSGAASVYEGVSSFLTDTYDLVDDFSNSRLGRAATAGYNYFMDQRKSINKQQVKGQRVSAPRGGSSGQALSAAQKADLGITPRVAAAAQAAARARNGSAISASIQQLAYKRSRAPLINVGDTSISVKPRAK